MKKILYGTCITIGFVLIAGFLIWAFSLHGTIGMFRVDGIVRSGIILFGALGLVLLGLALWQLRLYRFQSKIKRWLTVTTLVLSIIAIIVPVSGLLFLNIDFAPPMYSALPELILTDSTGSYGIPDISVVTYSNTPVSVSLTWGTPNSMNVINEERPVRQHVFTLTDLQPGTTYQYRINDGTIYYFTTPAINSQTLHFAASGDAHFGAGDNRPDLTSEMLTQIADPANNFNYFFSLGDLVEYGFVDSQWQDALREFSPTMSVIPTGFLPGNHDTMLTGLKRYDYYCYPDGINTESGSKLWHRIDVGKVHFLMLDIEWSAESYTPAQAAWLEEQLKSIPGNDWKIVICHGFFYASGYTENGWKWYDNQETIKPLVPLFEKYGVNLVLGGHDHQMELLQKSGVTYAICGAFGGPSDTSRTYTSPYSQWYASVQYGFVDVTLSDKQAEIVFRNPDFGVIKSFTISNNS